MIISTVKKTIYRTLEKVRVIAGKRYADLLILLINKLNQRQTLQYVTPVEIQNIVPVSMVHEFPAKLCAAKPQCFYESNELRYYDERPAYAVTLNNVKIFGSSNVVLTDGSRVLYEMFFYDKNRKYYYRDAILPKGDNDQFILRYTDNGETIRCGIMLSGNYSWNYYHFIFECLAKLIFIEKLSLPADIPFIVDEIVEKVPQYEELLNYFNCDNRKIIYLKPQCVYKVEELHYVSTVNYLPPDYKNISTHEFTDSLFNCRSIDYLREKLMQKMQTINTKKRVFLSRKNASDRRRYNEDEVREVFIKYDFELICPENHSMAEQIYLFNNADFIAGVSGAAFSNILFCKKRCKLLSIQSSRNELSTFSTIAKYLDLDLQYIFANDKQISGNIHRDFIIDPDHVDKVLADFIRK